MTPLPLQDGRTSRGLFATWCPSFSQEPRLQCSVPLSSKRNFRFAALSVHLIWTTRLPWPWACWWGAPRGAEVALQDSKASLGEREAGTERGSPQAMSHLSNKSVTGKEADVHAQWAGQVMLALSAVIHRYSVCFAGSEKEAANNSLQL